MRERIGFGLISASSIGSRPGRPDFQMRASELPAFTRGQVFARSRQFQRRKRSHHVGDCGNMPMIRHATERAQHLKRTDYVGVPGARQDREALGHECGPFNC